MRVAPRVRLTDERRTTLQRWSRRRSAPARKELIAAIDEYIAKYHHNPEPFTWTAKAETILKIIRRARTVLDKMQTA